MINLKGVALTILLIITCNISFAQKLQLEDLYKIYNLDSLALKDYCANNHFEPEEITEDQWVKTYYFRVSEKISFSRSYPKDSTTGMVYYYFDDHKDYKELKNNIRKNGFSFHRDFTLKGFKVSQDHFEYRNATEEIDLIIDRKNGFMTGFVLLLYKIPETPLF